MTGTLRCYSFHSVKGGVGKSTLSTALALGLARRHPDRQVVLIDLDLTGTSLSDVLPLCAPRWSSNKLDLLKAPDHGFFSADETQERITRREPQLRDRVPYLNDFLLRTDTDWSTDDDVVPEALFWALDGGPKNLRVIPSSALPADLERIIPVIFDEEHAPFLEARMEVLLDTIMPDEDEEKIVVIDTPPTIPGLSRSVISLAFRLGHKPKRALAEDDYIPSRVEAGRVHWQVGMVLSRDQQDLRAAERWLALVEPNDEDLVRVILNRLLSGEDEQMEKDLFGGTMGAISRSTPDFPTLKNFPMRSLI
ncbi:MAG TPA: hypothetical protein ENJ18_00700, partial [Nannocystis exedens]|nr:hypothetical protein [Nannocystis exedens]